ncbi:hypothetical protein HGM15179_014571 [Zosterops borbonicus]|uniref:Uncharacterized protein n=1 Tax=Zosterops borbonicus TaxID=364589 RepID=A0A8K1G6D5_9PASS|nr:hypothetical protein HGM15179_014571 [Zosterops borbonicus]
MVNELEYKSYEKQLRKLRLFSLGKKKLRKDLTAPGSKEVGGPLSFKGINSSSQFFIIYEFAQYPFLSCVQVIYDDVGENWTKDGALWDPTSERSPV